MSFVQETPRKDSKNHSFSPKQELGNNRSCLKFFLFNAQSIVNKVDNVLTTLSDKSIDIAAICETWLTASSCPTTAIIKSYGYALIHSFRKDRKGGGVALLYKSCYSLSPFVASTTFKS